MFSTIGPSTFFIHAVINIAAIFIVDCFYPQTSCHTLEEIDLLFASSNPFVWSSEKRFLELQVEHQNLVRGLGREVKVEGRDKVEVEATRLENLKAN